MFRHRFGKYIQLTLYSLYLRLKYCFLYCLKKSDTSDFFKRNKYMKQMNLNSNQDYDFLVSQIGQIYTAAQKAANQAIAAELLKAHWHIGCYIVEYEQKGHIRATYGKQLIINLAKDLTLRYGKGFSRTNLVYMRLFYIRYPHKDKNVFQLTWSHYIELVSIELWWSTRCLKITRNSLSHNTNFIYPIRQF